MWEKLATVEGELDGGLSSSNGGRQRSVQARWRELGHDGVDGGSLASFELGKRLPRLQHAMTKMVQGSAQA